MKKIFNKDTFSILGNIATIAMAVTAIFGYIYTVKPAFELKESKKIIEDIKNREHELIIRNNQLDDDITNKEQNIVRLKENENSLVSKIKELSQKENEYKKVLSQIDKKYQNLEQNYIELYIEEWRIKKREENIFSVLKYDTDSIFQQKNIDDIIDKLKNTYINPYTKTEDELEKLVSLYKKQYNGIEKKSLEQLIEIYKSNLVRYKDLLDCKEPDYIKWKESYILSLESNDVLINKCIAQKEKDFISLNEWDSKTVDSMRKDNFFEKYLDDFASQCQIYVKKLVDITYSEKWRVLRSHCMLKVMNMTDIILEKTEQGILEKIISKNNSINIAPPEKIDIETYINEYYFKNVVNN